MLEAANLNDGNDKENSMPDRSSLFQKDFARIREGSHLRQLKIVNNFCYTFRYVHKKEFLG